jgi:succinate dehydrogenase flavin-adding protein (antitoxin of CptAB toxin-antitoxin module)
MEQRWLRIEKLGIELVTLAVMLEVSDGDLARWVVGKELPVEQADIIEVGIAMLEMRTRTRLYHDAPTLRLVPVAAA